MSEFNLPEGWVRTRLGAAIDYGKYEKTEPSSIKDDAWVLELEDVEKDSSKVIQFLTFADRQSKSTKNKFKKGDVLYGKLRPYLNKIVMASNDGVCTTEIIPLNGGEFVHNKFIFYWLKTAVFSTYVTAVGYGVNMPRLGTEDGKAAPFVLAPLAEQQQIAQKLDELLAQVDTLKTRLDAIPKILKRFRQSVLAAAVSGRLTEEWRGSREPMNAINYERIVIEERQNFGLKVKSIDFSIDLSLAPFAIPESWVWKALGSVALKITDGAHNTPKIFDKGHPYLMAKDLTGGHLDFSEKRFISEEDHRELYLKCRPQRGDLLIVNIGAGTGNNVLVDVDFEFSFKNIAIIKRPSFINPKFLKYFYESEKQRIFSEQTKGGAQPFLRAPPKIEL